MSNSNYLIFNKLLKSKFIMNHQESYFKTERSCDHLLIHTDVIIIKYQEYEFQSKEINEKITRPRSCFSIKRSENYILKQQKIQCVNKINKKIRKFLNRIRFYHKIMYEKYSEALRNYVKRIQNIFRKYYYRISFRKNLIMQKFFTYINTYLPEIQKFVRRHLMRKKFKKIIPTLKAKNYLLFGDHNKIIKKKFNRMRLVKYDFVEGEDVIHYYTFDYISEIDQYILFIPKNEFHRENTLCNFYLDDEEINNYNYQTVHKKSGKFYNVLNLTELNQKIIPLSNKNHQIKDHNPNYHRSERKHFQTVNYHHKISAFTNGLQQSNQKKRNSSSDLKEIQHTPILKKPSSNLLISSKGNPKKVRFVNV